MYQLQPTASSLTCLMCLSLANPWQAFSFALSICWCFLFPNHPTDVLLEQTPWWGCLLFQAPIGSLGCSCACSTVRRAGRLRGQHGSRTFYLLRTDFQVDAGSSDTFAVPYGNHFYLFWDMWSSLTGTDFSQAAHQLKTAPRSGLVKSLSSCSHSGVVFKGLLLPFASPSSSFDFHPQCMYCYLTLVFFFYLKVITFR